MKVQITLTQEARESATVSLVKRGFEVKEQFEGPTFENAVSLDMSSGVVSVLLDDDTVYHYPMHTVARVKESV